MEKDKTLITYKGFDKDLKCRDFQYEIGKEYEINDKPVRCTSNGFHSCINPLDIFSYYPPTSRFAECESSGQIDEASDDTKIASSKIKIKTELSLFNIVNLGVEYIKSNVDWNNAKESNTGYRSAATNTGYSSAATNTGDRSAATNTGNSSAATNTGNSSAATNTGNSSAATNTGYYSAATNTGHYSAATNTGYYSAATNTGYNSAATNTGHYSAATNTGDRSAATNTGYYSAATNTGYYSAATNTGNSSAATNTGHYSAATNTGDRSAASVEGKDSIAIAFGKESKASGALGCYIVVSEWDDDYNLIEAKLFKVDGVVVKENTFYTLKNGELKED